MSSMVSICDAAAATSPAESSSSESRPMSVGDQGGGEAGVGGDLVFGAGLFKKVLEAVVGVVGGAEAGELAHGPEAER